MKVLIVDDEKIIRRGMVSNIPWRKLGLESPLEARNGQEALIIFERERPEILLTDIRMPLMDGIELTNRVRQLSQDVKIIYMSGFQDIKYIRSAFKNSAVDYILKPIEYQELLNTIEKAVRMCSEEMGVRRLRFYLQHRLQQSAPYYVRKLLADLVEGRFDNAPELERKLQFWGVDLDADATYSTLIVHVGDHQYADAEGQQVLVLGVEDLLQELMDNGSRGYTFHLRAGQFVCLVRHDEDEAGAVDRLSAEVQSALQDYVTRPLRCCAGPPVMGLFNLYESFQSALEEMARRGGAPARAVPGDLGGAPALDKRLLHRLAELLTAKDEASYAAACAQLITAVRESRPQSPDHTRALYLLVLGQLVNGAAGDEIEREPIDVYANCLSKLAMCESDEALHAAMGALLLDVRTVLQPSRQHNSDLIVAEICAILDEHLSTNVTIRELSRSIFLTPQYLCAVFKQRTGMTINDYVTGRRIERAKELLRSGRYKLYEIAPMVGYQDAKYFSRVFKRLTGMTPSEYL